MANLSVTLSPTSGVAGTVVTATAVRDIPLPEPFPIMVSITSPGGTQTQTFTVRAAPESLTLITSPAQNLRLISDDGSTQVCQFTAVASLVVTATSADESATAGFTLSTVTPPPPPPPTQTPVTNFHTVGTTTTSVSLAWANPVGAFAFTGVTIRRSAGAIPPASVTAGTAVTDTTASAVTFTDNGLSPNTQYSYAAFAHDSAGHYASAATLAATTNPVVVMVGPVTNFHTTATTTTTIALAWTNPTEVTFTGVTIRRLVGATPPATPSAGTAVTETAGTSYTDTGLTDSTQYSYAAFAHDATPTYAARVAVSVSTDVPTPPPPPPQTPVTNLHTTGTTTTSVSLAWTNPTGLFEFTGVMIRRAPGATAPTTVSAGTLVTDTGSAAVTYIDTGLVANTQYSYSAFAHDSIGTYATPATVTATTNPIVVVGPVTNLRSTATTPTTIALAWTNPIDVTFSGVTVRRLVGATPPATAAAGAPVVETTGTAYTDVGLTGSTQYSYSAFAHDTVPTYSTRASVTVTTAPVVVPLGPVTAFAVTSSTTTSVTLGWTNPTGADLAGVMVRRAAGGTPPASATAGTLVADVAAGVATLTDSGLSAGTQYSYAAFAHTATPVYATGASLTVTTPALPGTPYSSLVQKSTLGLTLASGPPAVNFAANIYTFRDFAPAPGVYGVDVTAQAQLYGTGIDQTIFEMVPLSSTAAPRVPAQSTGAPVQLALMAGEAQSRLWQDFTVRGTNQGHIYDGIRINRMSGPCIYRRVKVTGIPGNASGPPGETFSINFWHGVLGDMIDQCEVDGRDDATGARVASSMCGLNSSDSTLIQDSYFHHNVVAFGIANWIGTGNQIYRRVRCEDTASTGFHHENCFGTITLDHCTALRNGNGFHASANNSSAYGGSAVWNIIDPVFDGPKFRVQWYAGAYGGTQTQLISDIHLTINGVSRPDLLYVGPP